MEIKWNNVRIVKIKCLNIMQSVFNIYIVMGNEPVAPKPFSERYSGAKN